MAFDVYLSFLNCGSLIFAALIDCGLLLHSLLTCALVVLRVAACLGGRRIAVRIASTSSLVLARATRFEQKFAVKRLL